MIDGYPLTHRHEVYAIMNLLTRIFFHFLETHPHTQAFIMHAVASNTSDTSVQSKRLKVYGHFINRSLPSNWHLKFESYQIWILKK